MLNYTLLTSSLELDLVELGMLDRESFRAFSRWFWPTRDEYVARVTEWQTFLCSQYYPGDLHVGPLLVRYRLASYNGYGYSPLSLVRIAAVHQIAMLYWKEEYAVAPKWDEYVQRVTTSGSPDLDNPVIGRLAKWIKKTLGDAPSWDSIVGRMGSGATADRRNLRDRWLFDRPPLGVPCDFYSFNAHDVASQYSDIILTARAAAVPKNRKSARIVASEPSCAMFAQLALMDALDDRMKHLRSKICTENQERHRRFLVRHCKNAVTLDLSDASDYISMDLVNAILPADWLTLLNGCRSQAVRLPDGSIHVLATYAPMGNGYCFRILSLVCGAILATCCKQPWSDVGDDMICLDADYPAVVYALQVCGLKLNHIKTCRGPHYLESCGLELFDGYNVTPFKIKKLLEYDGKYCDLAAASRAAAYGLRHLAEALMEGVSSVRFRYNRSLQRCEYRIPTWVSRKLEVCCDGWSGMRRWHSQRGMSYRNEVAACTRTVAGYKWWSDNDLDEIDPTIVNDVKLRLSDAAERRSNITFVRVDPPRDG